MGNLEHKSKIVSEEEYNRLLDCAEKVVAKWDVMIDDECHGFDNMYFLTTESGPAKYYLYQCEECGKSYVLVFG